MSDRIARLYAELGIDSKEFEAGLQRAGVKLEDVKGKSSDLAGVIKGTLAAAIVRFGVGGVLEFTGAMLEQGVAVEKSTLALEAYVGSSEEAERAVEAIVEATDRSISRFDATQQATRLFAMGLAQTTEEAADLSRMAVLLGSSMGKGPQQSFEEFSLLLANQSIPRLDTFGISASKVRTRIAELQSATQGMTREAAFMQAVMEIGGEKVRLLEEAGFDAGNSMDRFNVLVADTKEVLATALTAGLLPWLEGIWDVIDAMGEMGNRFAAGEEVSDKWLKRMSVIATILPEPIAKLLNLRTEIDLIKEAQIQAGNAASSWDQKFIPAIREAAAASGEFAENMGLGVIAIQGLSEAELGRTALQDLNREYEEGRIPADEYEEAARAVMTELLNIPKNEQNILISLANIRDDFEENRTGAREYTDEILGLIDALTDLQTIAASGVRVPVEVAINGRPGID